MLQPENEMLLKDFIESNWQAWLHHCRENDVPESEAAQICEHLAK